MDPEAARIAAEGLAGMLNVEAKLLAFTLTYAPGAPRFGLSADASTSTTSSWRLRGVYEWRSRDLHHGIPFPQPLCEPPVDSALPMLVDRRFGQLTSGLKRPRFCHMPRGSLRPSLGGTLTRARRSSTGWAPR